MYREARKFPFAARPHPLSEGAMAGIVGALAMALSAAAIAPGGAGRFFVLIATSVPGWGVRADVGGAVAIATGAVIHLLVAVAWGMVFGWLAHRLAISEGPSAVALGCLFSLCVFTLMTFGVLRWAAPFMYRHVARTPFLVQHLFYGACLWLALPTGRKQGPVTRGGGVQAQARG